MNILKNYVELLLSVDYPVRGVAVSNALFLLLERKGERERVHVHVATLTA